MTDVAVPKTPARGARRREVAVVGEKMGGIGDVLAAAAGPARGPKPPAVSELLTNAIKVRDWGHECLVVSGTAVYHSDRRGNIYRNVMLMKY